MFNDFCMQVYLLANVSINLIYDSLGNGDFSVFESKFSLCEHCQFYDILVR